MGLLKKNTDAEDTEVIAAILDGDVNAFSILVERYQKSIFNLMFRMTGSYEDAADLAQESFIKAYDQLYRFQSGRKFFPWLYKIGLNHARNFMRRGKMSRCVSLEDCETGSGLDYPGQQEDKICSQLDYVKLNAALDQLPLDYREALILRYHEELSMEEVADALNLKVSAAKMRVHRGLAKVREILEKREHGKERA